MAHSGTLGHPLTPPRSGAELRRGALVALGVHGILFAALTVNIPWTPPPPKVVAAELWSAVPQSAPLPAAAEPAPPPTEPPPEVQPPPTPAPPEPKVAPKIPDKQVDAQIALEKDMKARAEKEKAEKAERAEKARLEKVAKEKADKAKADREKLEREKLAREKAQRAEKAEKAEAQKRAAAEEARVAQMREENLKRMMGQIGPAGTTGSTGTGGTAAKEASYSSSYEGKIRAAIKSNLIFNRAFTGNPKVIVEIRVGPSGTIISQRIKTRSGNPEWDEAVLRAVERTGTLPRDVDGRVPDLMEVTYGPADLMKN